MTATAAGPERIIPSWGGPLAEADYAALSASWITPAIADAAMLRRVDTHEGRQVVGQKGSRDCAGLLIPYYWPEDPSPFEYRIRRDNPDLVQGIDGNIKQQRKYLSPPSGVNRLYIPPGITLAQLADPSIPIVITEGEKKALALWRLANFEVDKPRFVPIGISGVWNWRGKVGKTAGQNGERLDVSGPIADLARIVWKAARPVQIVFDRNVHTNDSVKWARKGIARELATRGAEVGFVNLPEDCGVNGVDDLLASWGPTKVLELFEQSIPASIMTVVQSPQFQSTPLGMFRTSSSSGGLVTQVQISNFSATVTANIILDDGIESKREFEISAEVLGHPHKLLVSAEDFPGMDWPMKLMGAAATIFPNQLQYARAAIQLNSLAAEERRIYAHSGWREIGGEQLFLHAGGAVGSSGNIPGINVRFGGALERYQLRLPKDNEALVAGVRASLGLLDLGPPSIMFPLLAATFRSVFGGADFALHLVGETGTFKSELAALHQQHFGAEMDRLHLPGNWSSTANSLEMMTFHAKDALFVIDDFAPQGSLGDVARYHAAAERVFRAAGNHAGRNRLDSSARLREAKPPRALILSTGEDIPRGHSIRARLFVLEVAKGAIVPSVLSQCQQHANDGLYVEAMGGFLQRLARQYAAMRTYLEDHLARYKEMARRRGSHARTPDIIANLQAGFELFLDFSVECGVIGGEELDLLSKRCWESLELSAANQAKHQTATEPTAMYFSMLTAALAAGRAHLATRDGGPPPNRELACGWRLFGTQWSPQGDCLGWVDDDDLYLEPATAYRLVQAGLREAGETLSVTEQTLRKRLHERSLLSSIDAKRETITVRRMINSTSHNVLHFSRARLLPESLDEIEGGDQ